MRERPAWRRGQDAEPAGLTRGLSATATASTGTIESSPGASELASCDANTHRRTGRKPRRRAYESEASGHPTRAMRAESLKPIRRSASLRFVRMQARYTIELGRRCSVRELLRPRPRWPMTAETAKRAALYLHVPVQSERVAPSDEYISELVIVKHHTSICPFLSSVDGVTTLRLQCVALYSVRQIPSYTNRRINLFLFFL
jgi:hypothetical protein